MFLSDAQEENSGNLLVWPETHVLIHKYVLKTALLYIKNEDNDGSFSVDFMYTLNYTKSGKKSVMPFIV